MKIDFLDRSNYLKGLLILSRKDNKIAPEERKIIRDKAKELDFEARFVDGALADLMENKYLTDEPVKFTNKDIAIRFLIDAIKLAVSDKFLHRKEISYLRAVARINGISDEKYKQLLCDYGKIEATNDFIHSLEIIDAKGNNDSFVPI